MKGKATSVCRLDADSVLKKEVEPGQGDALSSARYNISPYKLLFIFKKPYAQI